MKIAIPVSNGVLNQHFGHSELFEMIELDSEGKNIISSVSLNPPVHTPGSIPNWLSKEGTNIIISGGMGQMAINIFHENGIDVILGAPAIKPSEIINLYIKGELNQGMNACDH